MRAIGGFLTGAVAGAGILPGAIAISGNLPASTRLLSQIGLVFAAVVCGFLAGAAIFGRRARRLDHLAAFSAMAGAVAGGLLGAVFAIIVTGSYLSAYGTWPQGWGEQGLMILAYPAFALLGLCIGTVPGLLFGLLAGGFARLVTPAR